MRLVLAVVLLPLLAEEGVADAAAAHGALLVAVRAVAGGRRVRTEEREVRLGACLDTEINVSYIYQLQVFFTHDRWLCSLDGKPLG